MDDTWLERLKNFLAVTFGIGIFLLAWYWLSKTAGRIYYLFWDGVYVIMIPAWAISRWMHMASTGYTPSADPALMILDPGDAFEVIAVVPVTMGIIGWIFGAWVEDRRRALDMVMVIMPLALLPLYMYIWGVAVTYPGGRVMYKLDQFHESCPNQRAAISQCIYTPKTGGRFL